MRNEHTISHCAVALDFFSTFTHTHFSCRNGISTETEPPKVEILGFVDEESDEPVTLRPNRFKPAAGIRNRLRNRLHDVLEEESAKEDDDEDNGDNSNQSTRYFILKWGKKEKSFIE